MRKILLCNLLFIKRSFKKLSFLFLLIALPILCYFLKSTVKEEGISLRAGIYIEKKGEITNEIKDNLIHQYESVSFEECATLSELKEKVASNTYECGYVLKGDFEEKLTVNDLNNIVELYTSTSTFMSPLSNEYIFSEIFKKYAVNELIEYIASQDNFTITDITQFHTDLRKTYEGYLGGDETFTFQYMNADNETIDHTELLSSYVLISVKGVIALIIMFVAFIGTFHLYRDTKCGIFRSFGTATGLLCKMSEIFSLTVIAGLSGVLSIVLCGLSDGLWIEAARMLLYVLVCTLYCLIFYKVVPNTYAFAALIPVFVLGSILFCRIFFDITEVIPAARYISWLFLPKYFFII